MRSWNIPMQRRLCFTCLKPIEHLCSTEMEKVIQRWRLGIPQMWDLHQLLTAPSDSGSLLIVFLPSFPKDKNKSYLRGRVDKPEVTNAYEEGMLPCKIGGWCFWDQRGMRARWQMSVWRDFGTQKSYRILHLIGCPHRKAGGWEPYCAFSTYISIPGLKSIPV